MTSVLHFFQQTAFTTTVAELSTLPSTEYPEIAFVGRSNAGKSSTINAIAHQNQLAFVSKMPGRTQHLNFFAITHQKEMVGHLVDLPGYGFSQASKSTEKNWRYYLGPYLQMRPNLVALVLILDIRQGLTEKDIFMLEWFLPRERPIHIVLNKADKLGKMAMQAAEKKLRQTLSDLYTTYAKQYMHVHIFSADRKMGMFPLIEALSQYFVKPI